MSNSRIARAIALLFVLLIVTTACSSYTPPNPLKIEPVSPVTALPELPERNQVLVTSYSQVVTYARDVKSEIEFLGGEIDLGVDHGYLDCALYFELYQQTAAVPFLDASTNDDLLSWSVDEYNKAIENILETAQDTYLHCEAYLLGEATSDEIAPLSWTLARMGVIESSVRLDQLLKRLEDELPDTRTYIGTEEQFLEASYHALDLMGDLGYEIDKHLIVCPRFIELYDEITALPEFDVAGQDPIVTRAHGQYRWAIDKVQATSRNLILDCEDFMTTGLERRRVPRLTSTTSREGLVHAMEALHEVVGWLEDEAASP